MYPAIKSNAISEDQARALVGDINVDAVMAINCDFTDRCISESEEVDEMSASIDCRDTAGDDCILTVLYLVDQQAAHDCDDLGNLDYSHYTFTVDY